MSTYTAYTQNGEPILVEYAESRTVRSISELRTNVLCKKNSSSRLDSDIPDKLEVTYESTTPSK